MEWQPGGQNDDMEDRRDQSGGGGGGFGGGGGGFGGGIGIVGFLILLVISLVTGRNFLGSFLGGGNQSHPPMQQSQAVGSPRPHPQGEDRDAQLISFTDRDVQNFWQGSFQQTGKPYRRAHIVLYRGQTEAGCGGAQSSTGPFYCPEDQKVYLDLSFWDELRKFGGSTADFAQAYVLSHELGHHVQNMLGTESKVNRLMQQQPGERNHLSVDLELQADCYGGVWAHSAQQRHIVDPGDVQEALKAVAAVGDDHLQKMSGRAVSPESWTHGSSAQREEWFQKGFTTGDPKACNTFGGN